MKRRLLARLQFCWILCLGLLLGASAFAQASRNLAPGFTTRALDSKLVVVSADIELFSISAGGVMESRADWTAAAEGHFNNALKSREAQLGRNVTRLSEADLDELAEINALHGAVAQAIFSHHMLTIMPLPTKDGKLDWTMGDGIKSLRDKTGADYALFTWIRDSYASAERKAAMIALALFGVGISGGFQVGYASLVDLKTGQVVWFNHLLRASGDMREAKAADESFDALLKGFPPLK